MTAVEPISTGPLTRREILTVFVGLMTGLFLSALEHEHRQHRAAHHRGRARRPRADRVGRHRLPAHVDGGNAAVRQALRPLRPPTPLPGRDRRVPRRLGALPACPRRWCSSSSRVACRASAAAASWPWRSSIIGDVVPPRERGRYTGFFTVGVRRRQRGRPAARRLLRRQPHVAVDLLHQHARSASSPWS